MGVYAYHPYHGSLTPEAVAEIKSHAIAINTWTVNEAARVRELKALGIDIVIGNFPDMVKQVLAE